jgi:predicted component of type VI protein secretion system
VVKTTIGRVEDNTFPIAQASVSSHHCEVILRGDEIVIKDLNSTNGTFINGNQITGEAVLKPGQTLRLGQVEMRLDTGAGGPPVAAGAPAPAPAAGPKPVSKPLQSTMVINKGVSAEQLVQGPQGAIDTAKGGFTKKSNKTNTYFIVGGIVFAVVILVLFGYLINMLNKK